MSDSICHWGILSTATIARKNWLAIHRTGNGVVTAVASRDLNSSQMFVEECQSTVPFDETPIALEGYAALLADDRIDAVYIPLPTGMRKEWVIRAANAGKHVLCEKPCAGNADDLREMILACESNGVQFMDGVMYMHSARMDSIRKVLEDPASIGEVKRIATQFSFNAPDEFKENDIRTDSRMEPQGCLGDLGWYTIRFSLWVMNYEMPTRVSGRILSEIHRDGSPDSVPMEFSGELFFGQTTSASFYNSFLTHHQQLAHISGTEGLLQLSDFVLPFNNLDATDHNLELSVSNSEFVTDGCDFSMNNRTRSVTINEPSHSHAEAQETRLFRKFADIVNTNSLEPSWPDASLKTQLVMDACLKSARSGGQIVAI